ncbi:metalloprotease [Halobacteriales archaeon QS_5_70_17]|nr:MAG: metalloprotease [Halobacteriales archaeon QS_5_70_17]
MRSFRIGSAFGIPIKLDLTFLLVLPLFAYVIGSETTFWVDQIGRLTGETIELGRLGEGLAPYALGLVAALGLFASVLLHELGHSLVAMRYGFPIASITLWIFGGIAQFSEMPEDWKRELAIALAGPVVSVALGILFWIALFVLPPASAGGAAVGAALFVVGYLAVANVALAAFNLLPAFPMDGGRVLRALLSRNRPYARATKLAAEVGKGFAILIGLVGLFGGFNIFLVGIAFFIYIGAASEAQQTSIKAAFEGVTVRDIMTPAEQVSTVPADASVSELLETMFRERHTGYPVVANGEVVGLVTLEDAESVREVERDAYTVEEIMSTELITVGPEADAMEALSRLQSSGIGRLLVMDTASDPAERDLTSESGELVGLVTRTDIMTALNIIRSSGSASPLTGRDPGGPGTPPDPGTGSEDADSSNRSWDTR